MPLSYFGIFASASYHLRMAKSIYSAEQELLQKLLIQARTRSGLTQTELAKKLKRPQSLVSKYESGERLLDVIELGHVCHALGLTLSKFVDRFEKALKRQAGRDAKD